MFDLVVKTHVGEWRPRRLLTLDEVPAYIKDALAMLGRAVPGSLADPEFGERLEATGAYRIDDSGVTVTVRRLEQIIQDDADEARAAGYESTARAHEQRLADYRAAKDREEGGEQRPR